MQILKGKVQKSVTINHIMNDVRNCICIDYYTEQLNFGNGSENYFINSDNHSISDLIEFLKNKFFDNIHFELSSEYYEYLIIYTNLSETEIKELIEWIKDNYYKIDCNEILITCSD